MNKQTNKKTKKKTKVDNIKTIGVPPIAFVDNIVFSKKEAWAYYVVSEKPYDFLSTQAKVNLGKATMVALGGLARNSDKKVECHIQIENIPFNVDSWSTQIKEIHKKFKMSENQQYHRFIQAQVDELKNQCYVKRVTYLGVKLFNRGSFDIDSLNILEFSFKDIVKNLKKASANLFLFEGEEITKEEEERAREFEKEIYRTLFNSTLAVKRPSSEELLLNLKKKFYPAMPSPYLETRNDTRIGLSDVVVETGGEIEVKSRYLKIKQMIGKDLYEGYRATLSFSKFPEHLGIPSSVPPFLSTKDILPYIVNCRFTLVPTEEMKKKHNNKKLDMEDELKNLSASGQGVTAGVKETYTDLSRLEDNLEKDRLPWIIGSYRVTIEADSEESLKEQITRLKNSYAKQDIVLTWTTGDQLNLFREDMYAGQLEINSFQQTTNLAMIAVAGINIGSQVGDDIRQRQQLHYKYE